MQSMPYISIVVPVFNAQRYLSQCIDSIVRQGRDDVEIILVDDGSTDASSMLCDQCEKDNPSMVTVIHQRNQGPLIARVRGFEKASGQYLISADADDLFLPGALKEISNVLHKFEPDVLMWGFTSSDSLLEKEIEMQDPLPVAKEEALRLLCETWDYNSMWIKAVKRSCSCTDVDYSDYVGMTLCEDFLQTLFVYDRANSFLETKSPLYFYRPNPTSTTHSGFKDSHYVDVVAAMQKATRFAENWESQFSRKNYVRGIAAKSLYSIVNYARDLSIDGKFDKLQELRASSFFCGSCSVCGAIKLLRPDRRLEVYLIKHGFFRVMRALSMLRLRLSSNL